MLRLYKDSAQTVKHCAVISIVDILLSIRTIVLHYCYRNWMYVLRAPVLLCWEGCCEGAQDVEARGQRIMWVCRAMPNAPDRATTGLNAPADFEYYPNPVEPIVDVLRTQ